MTRSTPSARVPTTAGDADADAARRPRNHAAASAAVLRVGAPDSRFRHSTRTGGALATSRLSVNAAVTSAWPVTVSRTPPSGIPAATSARSSSDEVADSANPTVQSASTRNWPDATSSRAPASSPLSGPTLAADTSSESNVPAGSNAKLNPGPGSTSIRRARSDHFASNSAVPCTARRSPSGNICSRPASVTPAPAAPSSRVMTARPVSGSVESTAAASGRASTASTHAPTLPAPAAPRSPKIPSSCAPGL
ncbi:MAG: hypothetical protein BWZ02_01733 [Lentisphaerae bacterium ADurb.BinA184]|nr:MAG: hypothetical protein BWZ02_01733 [Lentisphaerae bacterium ADurb.BinA184]